MPVLKTDIERRRRKMKRLRLKPEYSETFSRFATGTFVLVKERLIRVLRREIFEEYEEAPQDTVEQNGHIAQQAAGMPLETAPDRA
jgi:hypothetical protein